jgi:hypothetical protein
MKDIIAVILAAVTVLASCTKQGADLEQVTFKEDVNELVKDRKKSVDKLEMLAALPGYLISEVEGYHFGTVGVPNGSSVEFLFNSTDKKELAGLDINFKTDTSSKLITAYLFKKYGKPKTLQDIERDYDSNDNAYRSSSAYLWSNIKQKPTGAYFRGNRLKKRRYPCFPFKCQHIVG